MRQFQIQLDRWVLLTGTFNCEASSHQVFSITFFNDCCLLLQQLNFEYSSVCNALMDRPWYILWCIITKYHYILTTYLDPFKIQDIVEQRWYSSKLRYITHGFWHLDWYLMATSLQLCSYWPKCYFYTNTFTDMPFNPVSTTIPCNLPLDFLYISWNFPEIC